MKQPIDCPLQETGSDFTAKWVQTWYGRTGLVLVAIGYSIATCVMLQALVTKKFHRDLRLQVRLLTPAPLPQILRNACHLNHTLQAEEAFPSRRTVNHAEDLLFKLCCSPTGCRSCARGSCGRS